MIDGYCRHDPLRLASYLCYLREVVTCKFAFQSEFMHDPIGLLSLRSSTSIEHEGLLHPNKVPFSFENLLIFPGRLPVPGFRCSVRPHPRWVLPVLLAEEVPLFLPHLSFLCTIIITIPQFRTTTSIFKTMIKRT